MKHSKKGFFSITRKIVIFSILAITAIFTITSIVIGITIKQKSIEKFEQQSKVELEHIENGFNLFLTNLYNMTNMVSENYDTKNANGNLFKFTNATEQLKVPEVLQTETEKTIFRFFSDIYNAFPEYLEVYMGTTDGGFTSSFGGDMSAFYDPREREWYKNAASADGKIILTDAYFSDDLDAIATGASKAVFHNDKQLIGVVAIDVSLDVLTDMIDKSKIGNSGYAMLIQNDGVILADPKNPKNNFKNVNEINIKGINELLTKAESDFEIKKVQLENKAYLSTVCSLFSQNWKLISFVPETEVYAEYKSFLLKMTLIGSVVLTTFVILSFLFANKITMPIRRLVVALQNIAEGEGDLTVRLPVEGSDEITELSKYFNQTIEKIRNSIKKVSGNTMEMQKLGGNLSANMTETASAVNQISSNIEGVKQQVINQSASVTETFATMEEIIRTIEQLNSSIETQATSVTQSSASIEEMVSNIASISEQLSKIGSAIKNLQEKSATGKSRSSDASDFIKQIAEKSDELAEAANVIQNIAGQTNLLAMNAAIEAAHAGDAGKGFAVVADEIRKLAEESSIQGKQITNMIKETLSIIENVREAGDMAAQLYSEFYELTNEIAKNENQILTAMQEQDKGNKEVLDAIKTITEVTSEVKGGSAEMLSGGRTVAKEMQNLDELTRMITDSMNEMASGVVQINNAVQEVQEMAHQNKNAIDSLNDEVGKFKV